MPRNSPPLRMGRRRGRWRGSSAWTPCSTIHLPGRGRTVVPIRGPCSRRATPNTIATRCPRPSPRWSDGTSPGLHSTGVGSAPSACRESAMKAQSLVGALFLIGGALPLAACATPPLDSLHVPPGFHVALYSDAVPGARAMTVGEQGTVFVGSVAGQVYAVTDTQHAGQGDQVRVIATGLNEPTGLTMHDGDLYVSAVDRILRFPDIEAHLDDPPQPQIVTDQLPNQAHANGRFIAFGPD